MKKSLKILAVVTAVIMAVLMANVPIAAASAGTCEYIAQDKDTKGDWIDKYGKDGYIVYSREISDHLPAYAALDHLTPDDEEPSYYVWWDESDGADEDDTIIERKEGALYVDTARSYRAASCYYNNDDPTHFLVIDVGSETKYVSIYSLDYDENGRDMDITVRDESGKVLVNPINVNEFQSGVYVKFKISGKVILEYTKHEDTSNAVYGGIFFDSIEEAAAETVAAVENNAANAVADTAPAVVAPVETNAPILAADAPKTGDNAVAVCVISALLGIAVISIIERKKIRL